MLVGFLISLYFWFLKSNELTNSMIIGSNNDPLKSLLNNKQQEFIYL